MACWSCIDPSGEDADSSSLNHPIGNAAVVLTMIDKTIVDH